MTDLLDGLAELSAAEPGYRKAAKYYEGDIDEVMYRTSRVARKLAGTGERYKINFAKTPVNVVSDRMEIAAVTVPGKPEATSRLQTEVWDANQLTLETPDINRQSCMYGDGYLVVWPGEADGTVDIYFNSPITMRMIYDAENPRRKAYAIKRWKAGEYQRATLYYSDRIERWITKPGTSGDSEHDWESFEEDGQVWPTPNPFGEVPVFHLRTASPYGTPDHKDAYGAQDALNKLIITMMAATDYAGFPLRVALVEADAQVTGQAGTQPRWDDDNDATANDRGIPDELPVGPGDVWLASGLKGVDQFDAADPKHFLDPVEFLIRAMAQITTTPLHYFDPSGDVPSGESLRTADAPLVNKIKYRQQRFGSTYGEALAFALKVLGLAGLKVDVRWSPATSTDDKDSWETAGLKLKAGVPVRQVLLEQGYTTDQVDEWIKAAGEENLSARILMLVELGKAVRDLGTGISLEAVSAESVQAAIDAVLAPITAGQRELEPAA